MRKLYSQSIELRVIRSLCLEPESRSSQELLAKLDESHFATEVARSAWRVCMKSMKKTSEIPEYHELVSSPQLDESVREVLEECEYEPLVNRKRTSKAIELLYEYKKLRLLSKIGRELDAALNGEGPINADEEIEKVQANLAETRSAKNFKVLRIGKNSNALKQVEKVLRGQAITYIPTGFDGFDSINRGIPDGAYWLVAGPTGSGKSLLANVVAENMAMSGAKVGTTALEMVNIELLQRNLARVNNMDMTKLLDPVGRMSSKEIKEARRRFIDYDSSIAKKGGQMEFYEFDEDVTIETLTATVKPYGLDVLIIDYLGLLDETAGDDQWRALGRVTRYLHVWGKATGTRCIGMAQLSDEGMLRYSKQMAEHAKFFWKWSMDEISKQTGVVEIRQAKARQASDHSFLLKFDWAKMTVTDADKDSIKEADGLRSARSRSSEGRTTKSNWKEKKKEGGGGLSWEDDDSEDITPKPGPRAQKRNIKKKSSPKEVEL